MKLGWFKHEESADHESESAPLLDFDGFERELGIGLSERSRSVLEGAAEEARASNHREIGAEHLLVAVIDRGGPIATLLGQHGLALEPARGQVAEALWEQPPDSQLFHLNREAQGVMTVAVEAAAKRTASQLEPVHIAYGVASAGFEITSRVLHNLRVDRAKLVEAIEQRLDS